MGNSHAIWDHTVLQPLGSSENAAFTPSRSRYSI